MSRLGAVALVVGLVVSSCTADDQQSSTTSTTVVTTTTTTSATTTTVAEQRTITDGVSVTDDTIYIGLLTDLTGPFSGQVVDVVDAQIAFWDLLNREGGIAGRRVELVIANTGYDVPTHVAKYEDLKDRVVMFSHTTGSEHTVQIAESLVDDDRLAIPLTWYSGWSDPAIGSNLLEIGSNYCAEAINTMAFLVDAAQQRLGRSPQVAIATVPGDYGQDSAAGARHVVDTLGVDLVFDGEASIIPGSDLSAVVAGIAGSGADITWLTADPVTAANVIAGAVQLGYTGQWSGAAPTWNSRLLDTALGGYLAQAAVVPLLFAPLGADVAGMDEVYSVLAEAYPDRYPAEALIVGYLEYEVTRQVLEQAALRGDLTPAGVVAAAKEIGSLSFEGISPPNLYSGDANTTVSRASGLVALDKQLFDSQGGLAATLGDGARTPLTLLTPGFTATPLAASFDFSTPCYVFEAP